MSTKFYERTVKEIKDIEKPAIEYAEKRGWWQCKFVSPGLRGVPDRFFVRKGRMMLVEFKAPGKEPSVQQAKRMRELTDHGVEVHWVSSLEAVHDLFR